MEIWADTLEKEVHRERLAEVHKLEALRVASAYHTASETTMKMIARVIAVVLFGKERKAIYIRKG